MNIVKALVCKAVVVIFFLGVFLVIFLAAALIAELDHFLSDFATALAVATSLIFIYVTGAMAVSSYRDLSGQPIEIPLLDEKGHERMYRKDSGGTTILQKLAAILDPITMMYHPNQTPPRIQFISQGKNPVLRQRIPTMPENEDLEILDAALEELFNRNRRNELGNQEHDRQ